MLVGFLFGWFVFFFFKQMLSGLQHDYPTNTDDKH